MATHKNPDAPREREPEAKAAPATHVVAPAVESGPPSDTEADAGNAPAPTVKRPARSAETGKADKKTRNHVRKIRLERMMSKAELARRAAVSTLTIDRIERGLPCRMDTKRKILEALGLGPQDRVTVFGPDELQDEHRDERQDGAPAKQAPRPTDGQADKRGNPGTDIDD